MGAFDLDPSGAAGCRAGVHDPEIGEAGGLERRGELGALAPGAEDVDGDPVEAEELDDLALDLALEREAIRRSHQMIHGPIQRPRRWGQEASSPSAHRPT